MMDFAALPCGNADELCAQDLGSCLHVPRLVIYIQGLRSEVQQRIGLSTSRHVLLHTDLGQPARLAARWKTVSPDDQLW